MEGEPRLHQAYWATASGYQMSQIFVELWEATVKAPYPAKIDARRAHKYIAEVHDRVREHLEKALEGHRMNVELAKAYGVETTWSEARPSRPPRSSTCSNDTAGSFVMPPNWTAAVPARATRGGRALP